MSASVARRRSFGDLSVIDLVLLSFSLGTILLVVAPF